MDNDQEWAFRFGGIERLYGKEAFKKLKKSHVLIVGLGGVGSWAAESLARSGLGSLSLVDFDDICVSNTNRQLPAHQGNIGRLKTEALSERLKLINPLMKVHIFNCAYSLETEKEIFSQNYEGVVDAIDRSLVKFHLAVACRERRTPLVTAGSAGGKWDPTQIKMSDLSQTHEDRLLSILRKDLRRQAGFPREGSMDVGCVYSTEKISYSLPDGNIVQKKPENFRKPLDCSTGLGTVTHITGSFGFGLSHLIIKKILKSLS